MISKTPVPPYYAVIFTAIRTEKEEGYGNAVGEIAKLVKNQPGYLGHESVGDRFEITVSYWESLEHIKQWKLQTDHLLAQKKGRSTWYSDYKVRISKVERDYQMNN